MPTLLTPSSFPATPRFLFDPYALDGTPHGTPLASLVDQSGNGNTFTASGPQPTYHATTGWGVRLTNGGYLSATWAAWTAGRCSVIVIAECVDPAVVTANRGLLATAASGGSDSGVFAAIVNSGGYGLGLVSGNTTDASRTAGSVTNAFVSSSLLLRGYPWLCAHYPTTPAPAIAAMNARITSGVITQGNTGSILRFAAVWDNALTASGFDTALATVLSELNQRAYPSAPATSKPLNFSGGFNL